MPQAAPDAPALAADSLVADSLARDSILALRAEKADTSLIDTTRGVGGLFDKASQATESLVEGDVSTAGELFVEAAASFLFDSLIPAVVVGVGFYVAYRVVTSVVGRGLSRARRVDTGVEQLVRRALRIAFVALAGVTVLGELGINVTGLVAGLGIVGIAVGFAAQDTVQNLIAGVTILLDRPFQVGDNIELDDTFGTVEEITLRSTRVRTLDNQMAILPNSSVISNKIINHSMLRALRIVVPFGIAYKESPAAARDVVLALTEGDRRLHPDYAPAAVVTGLGASSVDMELRIHLKDAQLEVPIRLEYQEKVFDALKAADIEIPFPHLQLFIDEAKAFERSRLLGPGPGAEGPA